MTRPADLPLTASQPAIPAPIARVAELMMEFTAPWFVIGGWAVDSWLGRQNRDHPDVDIGLFHENVPALFDYLPEWHLVGHDPPEESHDDRWDGRPLGVDAHVHARHPDWLELDFNFIERSGERVILSRDRALSVAIDEAIRPSVWGIPTMAPEVVLWNKGKGEIRPRDEVDFEGLLPRLDARQREWLSRSLYVLDDQHPWLPRLSRKT